MSERLQPWKAIMRAVWSHVPENSDARAMRSIDKLDAVLEERGRLPLAESTQRIAREL